MVRKRKRIVRKKVATKKRASTRNALNSVSTGGAKKVYHIARNPMPTQYVCQFNYTNTGYIPAVGTSGDWFAIQMNDVVFPMVINNTLGTSGFPNQSKVFATSEPTSLSSLLTQNMYKNFRVISSVVEFRMIPTNAADSVAACIVPWNAVTTIPTFNYDWAEQQPFAKTKIFTNANSLGSVKNAVAVSTLVGVPESAIEYDLSGQYNGSFTTPPSKSCLWYIFYKMWTNTNNVGRVGLEVKIKYNVVLWNFATLGGAET